MDGDYFARSALVYLGLQSWEDPSLDRVAMVACHAMAGYGGDGVFLSVVGVMSDFSMTCYARSLLFSEFRAGSVDVPSWLREPVA